MKIPTISGMIDRRVLINYRVDPEVLAGQLPAPFRPQLVGGYAIGGICLIRLKQVRPRMLPIPWGLQSENAAHRFAVVWDWQGETRHGVYIPRRDTSSRLNSLAGGRIFPGEHHHATFQVAEDCERISIQLRSDDGQTEVEVSGTVTNQLPPSSVFGNLPTASRFFENGSLGYSATESQGHYDGLELVCKSWDVTPLQPERLKSSYFDDLTRFPAGSVEFDCALLMRGIQHEWHAREAICCAIGAT